MFRPAHFVVTTLAVLVLAGCGSESGGEPAAGAAPSSTPTVPTPLPATQPTTAASSLPPPAVPESLRFTSTTLDGNPFHGAALAGRPVVLWFWAPWCPKCRAQAAETAKVAETYRGKAAVVGVGGLGKTDKMRDFVGDNRVDGFPQLTDEQGAVWKRFEVAEQSTHVVLDAKGAVAYRGVLPGGEGLAGKLDPLVK